MGVLCTSVCFYLYGGEFLNISEKLAALPGLPGVYIMKNSAGTVIYVGKAKILKNRVRQYFHESANHTPKVKAMVSNIADFEYIVCDSEFEALCLESNLIKKYLPKYNILLKDDKHYPYIKIDIKTDYPQIKLVRKIENDGARYFGPYPGRGTVKNTIKTVSNIFKIARCNKKFPRDIGKGRPCLYYSMGKCHAPCQGTITSSQYKKTFLQICKFLEGNHKELIEVLRTEMEEAAEKLEFEKACIIRDKIDAVMKIDASQKVISEKTMDADIIASATDDEAGVFRVFFIRGGKLLGDDTFRETSSAYIDDETALEGFVRAYYDSDVFIPSNVFFRVSKESEEGFSKWLSEKKGKRVLVRTPVRGEMRKMLEMGEKNAKISLAQYKVDLLSKGAKEKAPRELAECLGLSQPPKRIEAYDISNTGGSENVASMIVFENGKPKKSEYKKFKIKYIVGSNDYDCMREVLSRRFLRYLDNDEGFSVLPDLLLVDGGQGHVNAAYEALTNLGIEVPLFGMAKDDHHKTRQLVSINGEVQLPVQSAAFRLVAFIQDEAHRFAITYHKNLRGKKSFESELEGIGGVGEKRRKALMRHFKSIKKIREATLEELMSVDGIDRKTALNILSFFVKK